MISSHKSPGFSAWASPFRRPVFKPKPQLAHDVLANCLAPYLGLKERSVCAQVSKQWNRAFCDPEVLGEWLLASWGVVVGRHEGEVFYPGCFLELAYTGPSFELVELGLPLADGTVAHGDSSIPGVLRKFVHQQGVFQCMSKALSDLLYLPSVQGNAGSALCLLTPILWAARPDDFKNWMLDHFEKYSESDRTRCINNFATTLDELDASSRFLQCLLSVLHELQDAPMKSPRIERPRSLSVS